MLQIDILPFPNSGSEVILDWFKHNYHPTDLYANIVKSPTKLSINQPIYNPTIITYTSYKEMIASMWLNKRGDFVVGSDFIHEHEWSLLSAELERYESFVLSYISKYPIYIISKDEMISNPEDVKNLLLSIPKIHVSGTFELDVPTKTEWTDVVHHSTLLNYKYKGIEFDRKWDAIRTASRKLSRKLPRFDLRKYGSEFQKRSELPI